MKRLFLPVLTLLLGVGPGCDGQLMPQRPAVYAAWEEGLTLGFENPALAGQDREQSRFQVRVKRSRPSGQGVSVVQSHTTLAGQNDLTLLLSNGGEYLGGEAKPGACVLPEGFPDRVQRWTLRGTLFQVVGRGSFRLPGRLPKEQSEVIGVWVEAQSADGQGERVRNLYLPDIGVAETQVLQKGAWTCVFRLVSRGFTDAPRDPGPDRQS
jgi:hypothetical protein